MGYSSPFLFFFLFLLERQVGVVLVGVGLCILTVFLLAEGIDREGVEGFAVDETRVYAVKVRSGFAGTAYFAPFAFAVNFAEFVADGFEVIGVRVGILGDKAEVFECSVNFVCEMVFWSGLGRNGAQIGGEVLRRHTVPAREKKGAALAVGARVGNLSKARRVKFDLFAVS